MVYLIMLLCIIITVIAIGFSVVNYLSYKDIMIDYNNIKNDLSRNYIKVTPQLTNAVIEALDMAKKKGSDFEIKAYTLVLDRLKGKW